MTDEREWFSLRFWAEELEKKYPRTNLFSLSDERLSQMLLSLDKAKGMPPLPEEEAYFSALASAWSVVQNGEETKKIPDAYI